MNKSSPKFMVNHYKNLKSNSHLYSKALTFDELIDYLDVDDVHQDKYHNGLFIIGDMSNPYRNNDNVINRHALCIDFDNVPDGQALINQIKQLKFSYIIYSTFNHTKENYRFRLIIPLSEPIDKKYYRYAIEVIEDGLGVNCDDKSYTVSQCMARQVLKSKDAHVIFDYQDTTILNVSDFMPLIKGKMKRNPNNDYCHIKRDSSHWDIGYGGLAEGDGRNNALASITGHLIRKNVDINLILGLLSTWNETNNPPLPLKEFETTVRSIITTELKRRGGE